MPVSRSDYYDMWILTGLCIQILAVLKVMIQCFTPNVRCKVRYRNAEDKKLFLHYATFSHQRRSYTVKNLLLDAFIFFPETGN